MQVYPLKQMTLTEAMDLQFHIVDCITREFAGQQFLAGGDIGVVPGFNRPQATARSERVIARIFGTEAALLVRGAGSAAIRFGLHSLTSSGDTILVHQAPVYPTTGVSLEMLGMNTITADFNDLPKLMKVVREHPELRAVLVQYTRQKPADSYDMEAVIQTIRQIREIPVITDDNYAVFKVHKIGIQCGADLSCFSAFKLLGPEGIGVIVGKQQYIDRIAGESYSGGMQTQGPEALAVLRGFVYAPVSLAIQAEVVNTCVSRMQKGEIPYVRNAFLANAQSRVILVEFIDEIAEAVLQAAETLGAAPYPVGAESKYEVVPMFYRVSGTFLADDPGLAKRMIRINPMRSGADTVLRILKQAVERVVECS